MTTRFSKLGLVLAVCAAGVASTGPAMAAGDATLTVQANVVGTCKWTTSSATLDFGALNPDTGSNVTGTNNQLKFWCTKGASYTIGDGTSGNSGASVSGDATCGTGVTKMMNGTADCIPYTFTRTSSATGLGGGPGAEFNVTVSATVLKTDYANRTAGNYSDTVTFTINP